MAGPVLCAVRGTEKGYKKAALLDRVGAVHHSCHCGDSVTAWHTATYDGDERADRLCGRYFPVRSGGTGELFFLRAEPVNEAGPVLSVFLPDCAECCMGICSRCHESGGDTYGKQEIKSGKSCSGRHCPVCRDCHDGFHQFHGDPAGYR